MTTPSWIMEMENYNDDLPTELPETEEVTTETDKTKGTNIMGQFVIANKIVGFHAGLALELINHGKLDVLNAMETLSKVLCRCNTDQLYTIIMIGKKEKLSLFVQAKKAGYWRDSFNALKANLTGAIAAIECSRKTIKLDDTQNLLSNALVDLKETDAVAIYGDDYLANALHDNRVITTNPFKDNVNYGVIPMAPIPPRY